MSGTPITYNESVVLAQSARFSAGRTARAADPARAAVPPAEYFACDATARWLATEVPERAGGGRRVALQFPDAWLGDARLVCSLLRERVPPRTELIVLGDTSYGECCVDEVAAAHTEADAVVHYGRSCLR